MIFVYADKNVAIHYSSHVSINRIIVLPFHLHSITINWLRSSNPIEIRIQKSIKRQIQQLYTNSRMCVCVCACAYSFKINRFQFSFCSFFLFLFSLYLICFLCSKSWPGMLKHWIDFHKTNELVYVYESVCVCVYNRLNQIDT